MMASSFRSSTGSTRRVPRTIPRSSMKHASSPTRTIAFASASSSATSAVPATTSCAGRERSRHRSASPFSTRSSTSMPSDARVQLALHALRHRLAAYRSYTAAARERVRTLLASDAGSDRARLELGPFGARIDATRFAELRHGVVLDSLSRARLERAAAVLAELDGASDEMFVVDVPAGDSL